MGVFVNTAGCHTIINDSTVLGKSTTRKCPWVLPVNLHGLYEYLAEARFQGGSFGVSIAKRFQPAVRMK